MAWWSILLITIGGVAAVSLLLAYVCYTMAFYAGRRNKETGEEYPLPPGEAYLPYRDVMRQWMQEAREMPFETVSIRSRDGLTLRGKYYELTPGAVVELMMPGYRGLAERDLCGGVQRAFSVGHNVLVVDQRACGASEGHTITFGVKESGDCRQWIDYLIGRFGPTVRIMLAGVSMGAATVMLTAGAGVPTQVIGVVADCGYTTAEEMIRLVIRHKRLPQAAYAFVRLGARVFGGFSIGKASPITAIAQCRVPVFFAHGEADGFVPCEMTRRLHQACPALKRLLVVPGADHGLSYVVDPAGYVAALKEMEEEMAKATSK